MTDSLVCPDPLAARRFDYGQAAIEDGDLRAAVDLFEQTLELAPRWAPAWLALAQAREKLGDRVGAAEAYRAALSADSTDAIGAGPRLALLENRDADSLPAAYVSRLFDDYAPRFDQHLRETLGYRGPELLAAVLDAMAPGRRFAVALDLGCGSGLAAQALRSRVDRLVGVDISPGMIARARRGGLYEELRVADLVSFLKQEPDACADLLVAADALVYLGDLTPVFVAAASALTRGGLFAFTVESGEEDFALADTLRFRHSDGHIRAAASAAKLEVGYFAPASTRRESRADAPGRAVALRKP